MPEHAMPEHTPDATAVLTAIARFGPYFAVGTGPVPDGTWRRTASLREPGLRDPLVTALAERMGTAERRVSASTLFFGYAARMWSVALAAVTESGRCIGLEADRLLWCDDGGIRLHLAAPRFGDDVAHEVLGAQLEPLVAAWGDIVSPRLLWGNAASALVGAGRVIGPDADPLVATLLRDPRLRGALDPATRRRRSCCLFYRTPTGGVCGDCSFTTPPPVHVKDRP